MHDPRQIEMFPDFDGTRKAEWIVGKAPMNVKTLQEMCKGTIVCREGPSPDHNPLNEVLRQGSSR